MSDETTQPRSLSRLRKVMIVMILIIAAVAITLLFTTETGRMIRGNPRLVHDRTANFTAHHQVASVLVFVSAYVLFSAVLLPVWWMQIIAASIWGAAVGASISLLAAGLAGCSIHALATWLRLDFLFASFESHRQRLHTLIERLGRNGFLTVIVVRLIKIVPFGASSYLFPLLKIPKWQVFAGTVVGLAPTVFLVSFFGAEWLAHLGW